MPGATRLLSRQGTRNWNSDTFLQNIVLPEHRNNFNREKFPGLIQPENFHNLSQSVFPPGILTIGQTLQASISPKQKMNRSRIVFGSCPSGIATNPNVL